MYQHSLRQSSCPGLSLNRVLKAWVSNWTWPAWATMSKQELSWVVYKIYNTVNVYKDQKFGFFFFLNVFLNSNVKKKQKTEQQKNKNSEILDSAFEKPMH